jgi:hypothetical protein
MSQGVRRAKARLVPRRARYGGTEESREMDVHQRTLYASMSASRVGLANHCSRLSQMPKKRSANQLARWYLSNGRVTATRSKCP